MAIEAGVLQLDPSSWREAFEGFTHHPCHVVETSYRPEYMDKIEVMWALPLLQLRILLDEPTNWASEKGAESCSGQYQ